jgi:DNA-binding NarL/FixJ family response regulator
MIDVLLVADQPLFRAGVRTLLRTEPGFLLAATATNEADAIAMAFELHPSVVVIEAGLEGDRGVALCHRLKQLARSPSVLLYRPSWTESLLVAAWIAGADAIADKQALPEELLNALRSVARGLKTLRRPPASAVRAAGRKIGAIESSIYGMCLHRISLHEISATLRIDPIELDAQVSEMIDRISQAGEVARTASRS